MKRIFKVINLSGATVYFDKKQEAKLIRNECTATRPTQSFTVLRGPDHWKGETF